MINPSLSEPSLKKTGTTLSIQTQTKAKQKDSHRAAQLLNVPLSAKKSLSPLTVCPSRLDHSILPLILAILSWGDHGEAVLIIRRRKVWRGWYGGVSAVVNKMRMSAAYLSTKNGWTLTIHQRHHRRPFHSAPSPTHLHRRGWVGIGEAAAATVLPRRALWRAE